MIKLILILLFSCGYSSSHVSNSPSLVHISDQDYITGEDGIIRMYVNVIGHVNKPGSYLVYDGIDLVTLLSLAGGPARGANLKKITIFNGQLHTVNFNHLIKNNVKSEILISPKTTVFVEESTVSRMFNGTNLISSILQLLNIAVTIDRTSD